MSEREPVSGIPTVRDAAPQAPTGGLELSVLGAARLQTLGLPERGDLVIGRDEKCALVIDHPSVSRRHARLSLADSMTLTDLESANGTFIREAKVTEGATSGLEVGELFRLGDVPLVVRPALRGRPLVRRTLPRDYFDYRVADECVRARLDESSFAVLSIRGPANSPIAERLATLLRPLDAISEVAPGAYDLLLADVTPLEASEIVRRIEGGEIAIGCACFPRDGVNAEALIASAAPGAAESARDAATVVVDPQMRALDAMIDRIAPSDLSVLVLGETGVGKERVAEAIHDRSSRASAPLVRLNCAAFTAELLESELFGHEKGAFTGASRDKPGLFESAAGGTVFLDEVGDMPIAIQAKLLRVLEERSVRRVGALESRPIDVRFVSATHRDLESISASDGGGFRADLFYRLAGISVTIPPLRDRASEILPLADHFLASFAARNNRAAPTLDDDARAALLAYEWPGNVRELRNVIERAALLSDTGILDMGSLPVVLGAAPRDGLVGDSDQSALREQIADFEQSEIEAALAQTGGNQTRAAQLLGISRRTLVRRLDRYGITRPRK